MMNEWVTPCESVGSSGLSTEQHSLYENPLEWILNLLPCAKPWSEATLAPTLAPSDDAGLSLSQESQREKCSLKPDSITEKSPLECWSLNVPAMLHHFLSPASSRLQPRAGPSSYYYAAFLNRIYYCLSPHGSNMMFSSVIYSFLEGSKKFFFLSKLNLK